MWNHAISSGFPPIRRFSPSSWGGDVFRPNLARGRGVGSDWHSVDIRSEGNTTAVLIDGREVLQYIDPEPVFGTRFSFESLTDVPVMIDEVQVWGLGTPSGHAWVCTGGPLGGTGYDVRMRPDDPDRMFVTDAQGGVFLSVDGGKSWKPSNEGITARTGDTGELIPIFCLTIDPHDPDIVWAGTQGQRGAFKSTDGGKSWRRMDTGILEQAITLRGFTVDPRTSDIVYTAGEISSWEWNGEPAPGIAFDRTRGVVYKTTDGGLRWKRIWEGDNLARYIWIDPRRPETLFVSTGIFDREAANSDPKTRKPGGVGIIKSVDGGATWTQINQGLRNLYIGSLFMHPEDPNTLLAGAGNGTYADGSGIYLTTNGGKSWTRTLDTSITSVEYVLSDPQIAYAGNINNVYRSEDGGRTWQQVTPSLDPPSWGPEGVTVGTPIDFQVDPRDPNRIFVNAYGGGNFLSEDGGRSWTDASRGYTGAAVRDIVVDPTIPGRVFAAARSGFFVTENGGRDWSGRATSEFKCLDWHAVAIHPRNPRVLLSELTCYRQMVLSSDGGSNWRKVNQAPENIAWRTIEFAPSNPDIVYAGTTGFISCGNFDFQRPGAGIQISTDGGASWKDANDAQTRGLSILKIAVHPQDPKTVLAASARKGLWKTVDRGVTWRQVAPETFRDRTITYAGFDPLHPEVVFAGIEQGGLKRSQDGGKTWRIAGYGIETEATVTDMVFDGNTPGVVYAADLRSGVYRSTDGGKIFAAMDRGLAVRAVNALALSGDGQHLYAATEGRGVFRLDLNGQAP